MKTTSEKKLNEIYQLTDNEDVKRLVLEIIRAEQSGGSKKFDYYKYVCQDKLRPVLGGVYHDSGYKVATDCHILVAIQDDYSSELEGKSLGKGGEILEGKYPNWMSVIPILAEMEARRKQALKIDFAKWDEIFSVYKAEKKLGEQKRLIKVGDSYYMFELFALVVAAMKKIGTSDWVNTCSYDVTMMGFEAVERKSPRAGISKNESGDLVLLMPINYDGVEGYYEL